MEKRKKDLALSQILETYSSVLASIYEQERGRGKSKVDVVLVVMSLRNHYYNILENLFSSNKIENEVYSEFEPWIICGACTWLSLKPKLKQFPREIRRKLRKCRKSLAVIVADQVEIDVYCLNF